MRRATLASAHPAAVPTVHDQAGANFDISALLKALS
jgi:hypothetical protein